MLSSFIMLTCVTNLMQPSLGFEAEAEAESKSGLYIVLGRVREGPTKAPKDQRVSSTYLMVEAASTLPEDI